VQPVVQLPLDHAPPWILSMCALLRLDIAS
jgi:hypothetical protein